VEGVEDISRVGAAIALIAALKAAQESGHVQMTPIGYAAVGIAGYFAPDLIGLVKKLE